MTENSRLPESAPDGVSVDVSFDGSVAAVTFQNGRHNGLSHALVTAIADAFDGAVDHGARAIVLQSRGRHFCAGADFVGAGRSGVTGPHISEAIPRLFTVSVPVVAAMQGAVVGGGVGLALSADFRVLADTAYMITNFTRLGICQGFGLSATLPRLIGRQAAADLLYTGRQVGPEEALSLGLVDQVLEEDQLHTRAMQLAQQLASVAPLALRASRALIRDGLASEVAQALAAEREVQEPLFSTHDFREGVSAWREKRDPRFEGR